MGDGMEARHSSDTNEHHSPPPVVEPARELMGEIDLDPASCEAANRVVRAKRIFTKADNGLLKPWFGKVWVNPPGGLVDADGIEVHRPTKKRKGCTETGSCGLPPGHKHKGVGSAQKRWWHKLVEEWLDGRVEEAVWLGFSVESIQRAQSKPPRRRGLPLPSPVRFPLCFPADRIPFLQGDAKPKAQGSLFAVEDIGAESGDSPPHSSYLAYLPPRARLFEAADRFQSLFEASLGDVVIPRQIGGPLCT